MTYSRANDTSESDEWEDDEEDDLEEWDEIEDEEEDNELWLDEDEF
jgi:hypothetical protein